MSMTTREIAQPLVSAGPGPKAVHLSTPTDYSFPKQFPMYQVARGTPQSAQQISIIEEGYYFGSAEAARQYIQNQRQRGVQSLVVIFLDSWETGGALKLNQFMSGHKRYIAK